MSRSSVGGPSVPRVYAQVPDSSSRSLLDLLEDRGDREIAMRMGTRGAVQDVGWGCAPRDLRRGLRRSARSLARRLLQNRR